MFSAPRYYCQRQSSSRATPTTTSESSPISNHGKRRLATTTRRNSSPLGQRLFPTTSTAPPGTRAAAAAVGHLYPVVHDLSDFDDSTRNTAAADNSCGPPPHCNLVQFQAGVRIDMDDSVPPLPDDIGVVAWKRDHSSPSRISCVTSQRRTSEHGSSSRGRNSSRGGGPPSDPHPKRVAEASHHQRSWSEGAATLLTEASSSFETTEEQTPVKFDDLYVLTRSIFQCEQSSVWECVHRESGQRYCVKIMDRSAKSAHHEVAMLQAAQSHGNVITFIQVVEDVLPPVPKNNAARCCCRDKGNKLYLITEYMSGGNLLSSVIQNGGLVESTVQKIALQLLQAAEHLHGLFMCHHDLDPSNILLGTDDSVKIADFGSAVVAVDFHADEPGFQWSASSNHISSAMSTASSLTARTSSSSNSSRRAPLAANVATTTTTTTTTAPCYRAPELLKRQHALPTTASDMWSIGVILYFCLFGHDESIKLSGPDVLLHRLHQEHPRKWAQTSRHAKQFLTGLLHMDPTVRMTASEALEHPWLTGLQQQKRPLPLSSLSSPLPTTQLIPPKISLLRRTKSGTPQQQQQHVKPNRRLPCLIALCGARS